VKFKSVKTAAELGLVGVNVELTVVDGSVQAVTLRDRAGHLAVIRAADSYSKAITILVPAPPETAKRHMVTGTACGLTVDEPFETAYEATERLRELERAVGGGTNLRVEERDVVVEPAEKTTARDDEVSF